MDGIIKIRGAKNEQIYDILKKDILSLKLPPGKKISETIIAEQYGTSRSPVRDALRRLEQEGLIVIEPQIGTFISDVSFEELIEIMQMKVVNDSLAAQLTASRVDTEKIVPIRKALEKVKKMKIEDRVKEQREFDSMLHMLIFENCGNRYLTRLCIDLLYYAERVRRYTTPTPNQRLQASLVEHERILQSLENKNPGEAYLNMKEHLEKVLEIMIRENRK